MKPIWLVSACLLGRHCRYDGGHCYNPVVEELKRHAEIIPVCPEMLGGLGVPRPPCEIMGGTASDVWAGSAKVLDRERNDRTEAFKKGAIKALRLCQEHGIQNALVKSNSPSCGCGTIYDGSFSGTKRRGNGVFTQCLLDAKINVVCDSNAADKAGHEWRKGNAGI